MLYEHWLTFLSFILQSMADKHRRCDSDYGQCIICQGKKTETLSKPKISSYTRFLDSIRERAGYGEQEYVFLSQRLHGIDTCQLDDNNAVWHPKCYAEATNKSNIQRAKVRHCKAVARGDSMELLKRKGRPSSSSIPIDPSPSHIETKITRSFSPKLNKELCFFCQISTPEQTHMCRTGNIGLQIASIVKESDNPTWKVNYSELLNETDALSRDISYHKTCITTEWQKLQMHRKQSSETHLDESPKDATDRSLIAAEVHFFSQLQDRIWSGEFITITEAHSNYADIMHLHKLEHSISRRILKERILEQLDSVEFTRPANQAAPSFIHSTAAADAAIRGAAKSNLKEDMTVILKCAKIVRKAIEESSPWTFGGSISTDHQSIPNELLWMLKWIVQGDTAVVSEARSENVHRSCTNFSQMIIQAHKTKRQIQHQPKSSGSSFRNRVETPLTLGLSLHVYHATRSKKALDMLCKTGVGVTYHHATERVAQIAVAVQENMTTNEGTYVPPNLITGQALRASIDNIDAKVDTTDGKNSFHALASAVYQKCPKTRETVVVTKPLSLNSAGKSSSSALKDVPKTGVALVPCTIKGTPKPTTSPHYVDFEPFQHQESLQRSFLDDIAWLLARYVNRSSVQTVTTQQSSESSNQQIPLWAAFKSLTSSPPKAVDSIHALPLINAPPQDWQTLVTSLVGLHKLNQMVVGDNDAQPVCVWLDMDLYKRAFKLAFLQPDNYAGKWILFPGQFHIAICALRCLGRTVEGSGLEEIWVEAEMYGTAVVSQILNGNHYSRAVRCHQITLQAFSDLWFEAFFEEHVEIYSAIKDAAVILSKACQAHHDIGRCQRELVQKLEELNLSQLMDDFDLKHQQYPMYKWGRMYMRQVENLLHFLRSTRRGDWELQLASLEDMCVWFFAYNRLDYEMHIPEFIARMYSLKDSHPVIWEELASGGFVVQKKATSFTAIGIDQAQEHINKTHKGEGGICGITTSPETLLRYCLSTAELSRLSGETEDMIGYASSQHPTQHHELSERKLKVQEKQVQNLKGVLAKSNPFRVGDTTDGTESKLVHFTQKIIIKDDVQASILSTVDRGTAAYQKFVDDRIHGDQNLWGKMSKIKHLGWNENTKSSQAKIGGEQVTLKASNSLMTRLLVLARSSRDVDLKDAVCTYEFSPINHMLMTTDGLLHPCHDKSQLIHLLEQHGRTRAADDEDAPSAPDVLPPDGAAVIIDAMAVVHEMAVFKHEISTCRDLAEHFVGAINIKSRRYSKSYVVFDQYSQSSLKETTRKRRTGGKVWRGTEYKVDMNTRIKDLNKFLSSTKTKELLTIFLAHEVIVHCTGDVTTVTSKGVECNTSSNGSASTAECKHDEADTLLIYYASEARKLGLTIHIYSQDTDVLVLAIYNISVLGDDAAMIMGTGENRHLVKLLPIYLALGEERSAALLGFHAISGSDTTGRIFGKSKTSWWKTFMECGDDVISALALLGQQSELSPTVLVHCETFICKLLSPKSVDISQAAALRWHHFRGLSTTQGIEKLPPTQGSLHEIIRRAHYQCIIWGQTLVPQPTVGSPTDFGWSLSEASGDFLPILSRVPLAPDSILQLVRCKCTKSQCGGRCSCRENDLPCTELCKCDPDGCKNLADVGDGNDESD